MSCHVTNVTHEPLTWLALPTVELSGEYHFEFES
jgi:hypothetical protein